MTASIPEIIRHARGAGRLLLLLDFDGTLAPLQSDPAAVWLPEPVKESLRRLARSPRVRAGIVSGRALADIRRRAGLEELLYGGNFGTEIEGCGLRFVEPSACALAPHLQGALEALRERLRGAPHVRVENKGLTAAVHMHGAGLRERARIGEIVRAFVEASPQFRAQATRDALDILPRGGWDKGAAVQWIRRQLGMQEALVLYAGDDVSDEHAFAALQGEVTIKVGAGPTDAAYRAADPPEIWQLLARLERALAGTSSQARAGAG